MTSLPPGYEIFPPPDLSDIITSFTHPITIGVAGITDGGITLESHVVGDAPLGMYATNVTFLGVEQAIIGWGYNIFGVIPGNQQIFVSIESNYQYALGLFACEWYVQISNVGNTDSVRPFMTSVDKVTLAGANYYSATNHYFTDVDGNIAFELDDGTPPTLWINGTTVIAHATNNIRWLNQMNTTGTVINLLWLDSSNRIILGQSGYHTVPADDIEFNQAALGLILTDRVTGAGRRILSTNGVLSTEAI